MKSIERINGEYKNNLYISDDIYKNRFVKIVYGVDNSPADHAITKPIFIVGINNDIVVGVNDYDDSILPQLRRFNIIIPTNIIRSDQYGSDVINLD